MSNLALHACIVTNHLRTGVIGVHVCSKPCHLKTHCPLVFQLQLG